MSFHCQHSQQHAVQCTETTARKRVVTDIKRRVNVSQRKQKDQEGRACVGPHAVPAPPRRQSRRRSRPHLFRAKDNTTLAASAAPTPLALARCHAVHWLQQTQLHRLPARAAAAAARRCSRRRRPRVCTAVGPREKKKKTRKDQEGPEASGGVRACELDASAHNRAATWTSRAGRAMAAAGHGAQGWRGARHGCLRVPGHGWGSRRPAKRAVDLWFGGASRFFMALPLAPLHLKPSLTAFRTLDLLAALRAGLFV